MTVPRNRLASRVRRLRHRAGLTQRELADRADLSVAGLRDIEQGRVTRPRAASLRRLANAMSLSQSELDELLREADGDPTPAAGLWIGVLGPLRLCVDGRQLDPGSETQRVLLASLALTPNLTVARDLLIRAVWGPDAVRNRAELLHSRISRLRRRLRGGRDPDLDRVLVADRDGYRLRLDDGQHDLLEFRGLVTRARDAGTDPDKACALFATALALWRGQPMQGLPALEAHPVAVALAAERRQVVIEYARLATTLGRHREVLPALIETTQHDPLDEAVHAALLIALAGSGQQAAALHVFDRLRRRLATELGTYPGGDLRAAYQRVLLRDVPRQPPITPVAARLQLPPDSRDFSGRAEQVRTLREALTGAQRGCPAAGVVVEGMAGIGKTQLVIHTAHQLREDGERNQRQLYVDLRGYAEQPPADPAEVLDSFLRLLGVPAGRIPPGIEQRAALYRDRLRGRRAIVVLDNASSADQVRPLLPSDESNAVVVTSRRSLAIDGARVLRLEPFRRDEAVELLTRVAGARRIVARPSQAHRVVELCAFLPLAVALAARRLQARPNWTVADLVARLESGNRIDELSAGGRCLRSVFELSYRALDPQRQRAFQLLGAHIGTGIDHESATALLGHEPSHARRLLTGLVEENLLTVVAPNRYHMHDLLVEYARSLT